MLLLLLFIKLGGPPPRGDLGPSVVVLLCMLQGLVDFFSVVCSLFFFYDVLFAFGVSRFRLIVVSVLVCSGRDVFAERSMVLSGLPSGWSVSCPGDLLCL